MAAIIARITRSNRERLEKKKYEIIISKCMYEILPFGECFDPVQHNKYVLFKNLRCETEDATAFHKLVLERLNELEQDRAKNRTFKLS